jgi:predicted peptidase
MSLKITISTKGIIIILLFVSLHTIIFINSCLAQDLNQDFLARSFVDSSGMELPYRLFIPKKYNESTLYPIVIYLHGSGGVGVDNIKQISGGNTNGTHAWITPENQLKHPSFVLAPQLPQSSYMWDNFFTRDLSPGARATLNLLNDLMKEFSIDPDRIYITGQSAGGFGVWDIVSKHPDLFAAAIPLCGGGNPLSAKMILDVPIWIFHGANDPAVPVEFSREMANILDELGGNIKYTEYPEVGHEVWEKAYLEPELIEWLFKQKRK